MTNHPRQREMWDGLTATGCLSLILSLITVIIMVGVIVEWLTA